MEVGQIVISKAGRDKGYFLVISSFCDGKVYVCDGKERPIERPKPKNPKHLSFTSMKIDKDSMRGNKALKKAINALSKQQSLND